MRFWSSYIQTSGSPKSHTIAPINEPANSRAFSDFGPPAPLSEEGATRLLKYMNGVVSRVEAANPNISVMFEGSFKGEEYWSGSFSKDTSIVFDLHHHYLAAPGATPEKLSEYLWADELASPGDAKFPVFVGEWAIQAAEDNTLVNRDENLNMGLRAWKKYARGSSYWTARFFGDVEVVGEAITIRRVLELWVFCKYGYD
ncbi:hypothetical protein MKZ38_005796 [Zalerion maritima]|uniref:glucan 1,3-beta-glucosidase n=1 Tax=Zalerion maritima TaxID=339359 RepID=A0AAD5RWT0_9PEZI|nr:hypothetical protein MKZ38_005796 [Zalerion maritima]